MNVDSSRKVVPAVLIYARSEKHVLMIHRDGTKKNDIHEGKWNGLGGKIESSKDESPREAAQREFFEESGIWLSSDSFQPLGWLFFPFFKPEKNEDWVVFVFECKLSRRENFDENVCSEGMLAWVREQELLDRPLWPGDRVFLPYVLASTPFFGTFWYEHGDLKRFEFQSK